MSDISTLSKDFDKWAKNLSNNINDVFNETATNILEELKYTSCVNTGAFRDSLEKTEPAMYDGYLKVGIGSNLEVKASNGKAYKLGQLLEHGTPRHTIVPVNGEYLVFKVGNKKLYNDVFGSGNDADLGQGHWVRTKEVHHPGTVAYNQYFNALNNNMPSHRARLSKAIKESLK